MKKNWGKFTSWLTKCCKELRSVNGSHKFTSLSTGCDGYLHKFIFFMILTWKALNCITVENIQRKHDQDKGFGVVAQVGCAQSDYHPILCTFVTNRLGNFLIFLNQIYLLIFFLNLILSTNIPKEWSKIGKGNTEHVQRLPDKLQNQNISSKCENLNS